MRAVRTEPGFVSPLVVRRLVVAAAVLAAVAGLILSYFVLEVGPAAAATDTGATKAKAVDAGSVHTCAITDSGGVKCWGKNAQGQLGDDTRTDSPVPVDVVGLGSGVAAISAADGGASPDHTCALTESGGIKCWGYNAYGQLGDGRTVRSLVPVDVVGLGSGVKAISANGDHTCALTDSGGVKCWGRNGDGELGDGTTTDSLVPVDVKGLPSGVKAISSSVDHTCALTDSEEVKCWGKNGSGQLGDGTRADSSVPVDVKDLPGATTAISAGHHYTCARRRTGSVRCWGYNAHGQLGDGTTTTSLVPVMVMSLGDSLAVSADDDHTCVRTPAPRGVECWGRNLEGQLGDGTRTDSFTRVGVVGLGSGATAISAGGRYTCALNNSGRVKCWGANGFGQLGDGTITHYSLVPVDVKGLG
jgi:alpha-tubulin suppressor-like RCC1 family protein